MNQQDGFWSNLYQTQPTVFYHVSKHWEESWNYDVQQSIFDKLHVFGNAKNTVSSTWYTCEYNIYLLNQIKTKKKTKLL